MVDLEQLRPEHGLSVAGFCRAVGLSARTYYDRRADHHADHEVRGPWPTPARDGIRARVVEVALRYPMWGHRKIAWLARHEHGLEVCDATCLRILREAGLTLPVDYVAERRNLAGARREAFLELPTRRNRVWQMDFFELETTGGGTWRSGDVIDYATKLVLAGPVTATQTTRDAIRVRPGRGRAGREPARPATARGPHRSADRPGHPGLPGQRQRPLLHEQRVRSLHRLPARAHARGRSPCPPNRGRSRNPRGLARWEWCGRLVWGGGGGLGEVALDRPGAGERFVWQINVSTEAGKFTLRSGPPRPR